jgi:anti-anti-sigma factor
MFEFDSVRDRESALFMLRGEMSMEDSFHLRQAFFKALQHEPPPGRLVVDFRQVKRIDSAMISLLVATKNVAKRHGAGLHLTNVPPREMRLFHQTNLDRYFDIQPLGETSPSHRS